MLPVIHALTKCHIEAERAIQRLKSYAMLSQDDSYVKDGTIDKLLEDFQSIVKHIPDELRKENQK